MTILPPFNEESTCPKCSWRHVAMKYRPYPLTQDGPDVGVVGEHMLRVCERCGYHWRERVIGDEGNRESWPAGVSIRTHNALQRAGVHSVAEADCRTDEELLDIRNLGRIGLAEIRALARGEQPPEPPPREPPRVHFYRTRDGLTPPCGASAYPDQRQPDVTDDATEVTCRLCIARLETWDRRLSG